MYMVGFIKGQGLIHSHFLESNFEAVTYILDSMEIVK